MPNTINSIPSLMNAEVLVWTKKLSKVVVILPDKPFTSIQHAPVIVPVNVSGMFTLWVTGPPGSCTWTVTVTNALAETGTVKLLGVQLQHSTAFDILISKEEGWTEGVDPPSIIKLPAGVDITVWDIL